MNEISKQSTKSGFTPTPGMVLAAENVFHAMAYEQTVRPIVEAYQNAILAEGKWCVRPEFSDRIEMEVITECKHAYLMSEVDFADYVSRCKVARNQAGLKVEHDDQCPLLVAENVLIQARLAMVNAMSDITKIPEPGSLPILKFKQLVELTLRLLAPFVAVKNP